MVVTGEINPKIIVIHVYLLFIFIPEYKLDIIFIEIKLNV